MFSHLRPFSKHIIMVRCTSDFTFVTQTVIMFLKLELVQFSQKVTCFQKIGDTINTAPVSITTLRKYFTKMATCFGRLDLLTFLMWLFSLGFALVQSISWAIINFSGAKTKNSNRSCTHYFECCGNNMENFRTKVRRSQWCLLFKCLKKINWHVLVYRKLYKSFI